MTTDGQQLMEAFSEVEGDLEEGVYQALAPLVHKITAQEQVRDVQSRNMECLHRIMSYMEEFPLIELSTYLAALDHRIDTERSNFQGLQATEIVMDEIQHDPRPRTITRVPDVLRAGTEVDRVERLRDPPRQDPFQQRGLRRTAEIQQGTTDE